MSYKDSDDDDYRYETKQGESKESFSESKSDDKESTKINLVESVQEFIFGNEALAKKFENFVNDRCHIIDLESTEYKLEYTETFNDYKALFERTVEGFIVDDLKSTVNDFYIALKDSMEKDEYSNESIFAQILMAMGEFDIFMTMMREAKRNLEYRADHK